MRRKRGCGVSKFERMSLGVLSILMLLFETYFFSPASSMDDGFVRVYLSLVLIYLTACGILRSDQERLSEAWFVITAVPLMSFACAVFDVCCPPFWMWRKNTVSLHCPFSLEIFTIHYVSPRSPNHLYVSSQLYPPHQPTYLPTYLPSPWGSSTDIGLP